MAGPSLDDIQSDQPNMLDALGQNSLEPAQFTNADDLTNPFVFEGDQPESSTGTAPLGAATSASSGGTLRSIVGGLIGFLEGLLKKL